MRKIGIFGGTFDPIHLGHLIVAEQCRETATLDEVWFMPASSPPHKQSQPITSFERRVEMIELGIVGNPAFRVEPIENERVGPSYTADTLDLLHHRHPQDELFLLIGSDSLRDLPGWYQPHRIVARATLLVMLRAGLSPGNPDEVRKDLKLADSTLLKIQYVPLPPVVDISSSDLRQRVASGKSIRYLVPRAVECYILEKRLYR